MKLYVRKKSLFTNQINEIKNFDVLIFVLFEFITLDSLEIDRFIYLFIFWVKLLWTRYFDYSKFFFFIFNIIIILFVQMLRCILIDCVYLTHWNLVFLWQYYCLVITNCHSNCVLTMCDWCSAFIVGELFLWILISFHCSM